MFKTMLHKISAWGNQAAQVEQLNAEVEQLKAENDRLKREHSTHKDCADDAELCLRLLGFNPRIIIRASRLDDHAHYLLSCVDVKINPERLKEKSGLEDVSSWETFYNGLRIKSPGP